MAAIRLTENKESAVEEIESKKVVQCSPTQPVNNKSSFTRILVLGDQASKVRMLCLDGGGVRGVIEAMTLKYIHFCLQKMINGVPINQISERLRDVISNAENNDYQPKGAPNLHKMFDIIVGTSMGAVVSVAMARLHMSAAEICNEVKEVALDIFPERKYWHLKKKVRSKISFLYSGIQQYNSKPLERYLQEMAKDISWSGLEKDPLFGIVATKAKDSSIHFFNSKKYAQSTVPLWQAIRASTAAPIYFPSMIINDDVIGEEVELIDGGLCSNSPASYAMQMLEPNQSLACLISLGCGENEPSGNPIVRAFQHARNSAKEWEKFKFSRSSQEHLYRIAPSLSSGLGKYKLSDSKRIDEMMRMYDDWLISEDSNWYRIEIIQASACLFAKSLSITEASLKTVSTGYCVNFVFNADFSENKFEKEVFIRTGFLDYEKVEFQIDIDFNEKKEIMLIANATELSNNSSQLPTDKQKQSIETDPEHGYDSDASPVLRKTLPVSTRTSTPTSENDASGSHSKQPITLNGTYEKRKGEEAIKIMFLSEHHVSGSPVTIKERKILKSRTSAPGRLTDENSGETTRNSCVKM